MRSGILTLAFLVFVANSLAGDLDFALTLIPRDPLLVEIVVPVDELRFVDEGDELAARVSIRVMANGKVVRVIKENHRIAVPRGTAPQGSVTFVFEVRDPRVTISVVDENAGVSVSKAIDYKTAGTPDAEEGWQDALARAAHEKKPIVVFYRSPACTRCRDFERDTVPHPTIARRLTSVVFATLPAKEPAVALFDREGVLRARWAFVPDTTNFGVILDSVIAVAPHFERGGEVEMALALAKLGRVADARAALLRAREDSSREVQQAAIVATAILDAKEGHNTEALRELETITANASTTAIAADAWMATAAIHRSLGASEKAIDAYTKGAELVDADSPLHAAAEKAVSTLRAAQASEKVVAIRILPLGRQVVTGRHTVRTQVASAAIAQVTVSLDGREVGRIERPPFSTTLDFGVIPERHAIAVVAFDRHGHEIGRDERVVNDGGETFSLRLLEPREGFAAGLTRVLVNVRAPSLQRVQRVVVSWNDAQRAVLTESPWETSIEMPSEEVGVLRAVAELDDGRTSEDAVLLNAGGFVDKSDVQLVELPITLVGTDNALPQVRRESLIVREGQQQRRVEAVASAAETPLTIGLLIDVSASMQKALPDVQEAAIRFLQTILGDRDRAFLITFDTRARLVQPATSDLTALHRRIMSARPDGLTALHDAMALGLLQFEGVKGRRAMIVFSDGNDRTSRYTASEVAELARRTNVPIHVIASRTGAEPTDEALARIAPSTGGTFHTLDDLGKVGTVYADIEAALRAQILAFIRTDPGTKENEWRRIQIEIEGQTLGVYAPDGYYAPW